MYFTFQESRIWESGNPVDPSGRTVEVRGKTEDHARKKLRKHKTSIGRVWVLVKTRN